MGKVNYTILIQRKASRSHCIILHHRLSGELCSIFGNCVLYARR